MVRAPPRLHALVADDLVPAMPARPAVTGHAPLCKPHDEGDGIQRADVMSGSWERSLPFNSFVNAVTGGRASDSGTATT